jgi:hypothetical protein
MDKIRVDTDTTCGDIISAFTICNPLTLMRKPIQTASRAT